MKIRIWQVFMSRSCKWKFNVTQWDGFQDGFVHVQVSVHKSYWLENAVHITIKWFWETGGKHYPPFLQYFTDCICQLAVILRVILKWLDVILHVSVSPKWEWVLATRCHHTPIWIIHCTRNRCRKLQGRTGWAVRWRWTGSMKNESRHWTKSRRQRP